MTVLRVALDLPLPRLFDYSSEDATATDIGLRVQVPFGRKAAGANDTQSIGVIVEIAQSSEVAAEKLKPATRILRDAPALPPDWLDLARFCASYYQKPLGEVMLSAMPRHLRTARRLPLPEQHYRLARQAESILAALSSRALRKRALVETLASEALDTAMLRALPPASRDALRDLVLAGHVITETRPRSEARFIATHTLNAEQSTVIDEVARIAGSYSVHLLFGVTGSGKTEIYFHLISRVLAAKAQALVLVPEIALTPALQRAFQMRFPGAVIATQHSAMSDLERARGWLQAQNGQADIVLGTRLAAFVPLQRPGLIVIDEEQDASFKQQDGLRYNARDLAIYRARKAGIPVVLASATPSLESYQHALSGRYRLHILSSRAHAKAVLPAVRMVDTRKHPARHGLCEPVIDAIAERLARGELTLVFLNRRGYAPVLTCPGCAWISDCPDCASHLVLHLAEKRLRCHHCGHADSVPRACPACGNLDLQALGRGTQRLEATLQERFPAARVLRIDGDTTRHRGSLEHMLGEIRSGSADILLGTQILAKGHDFENVTLVVVLNADAGLFAADYRASERLFAQLEQVAGRAGRARLPGEVWIQTRFPEHPLYQALGRHDYAGFAQTLLAERRQAEFPPFVFEAALRAESAEGARAAAFLAKALALAPQNEEAVTLFRPVPMSLPRLAKMERVQVLAQSGSRPRLQAFLREWSAALYGLRANGVRWHIDVDPTEF